MTADRTDRKPEGVSARSKSKPRIGTPWAVLIGGLLLTTLATILAYNNLRSRVEQRFQTSARDVEEKVNARMESYNALLRGAAALFAVDTNVSRAEWSNYVERLRVADFYPGVQGLGFTKRVRVSGTNELVEQMRREGVPDFRIWPATPAREEYHSILFLEPLDARNRAALGFDMFTEPVRRTAMWQAWTSAAPVISGKVRLVQETMDSMQAGFLIYVPAYGGGAVPETLEARREQLLGFAYCPFRADDLFRGILGTNGLQRIHMEVYDGTAMNPEALLYRSVAADADRSTIPRYSIVRQIDVSSRRWVLRFTSPPEVEGGAGQAMVASVPLAGVFVTLLLFLATRRETMARKETERTAAELAMRSQQLRASEELYRTISDTAADGILTIDEESRIVALNPAAEKLFGYTAGELIGQSMNKLMPARMHARHDAGMKRYLDTGKRRIPWTGLELPGLHRDGHEIPLEVSFGVSEANGRRLFTGLLRDITARKRVEETLRLSEQRFQLAVRATNDAVWDWDFVANTIWWNEAVYLLFGYTPAQVSTGITWWQAHLHPQDHDRVVAGIQAVIDGREVHWRDEYRFQRANGEYAEVLDRGYVIRDESGKAVRMLGAMQDLTERKRREQTLRFLVDLNVATQGLITPDEVMTVTARKLAEHLHVDRCAYAEVEEESVFVITGDYSCALPSIVGRWPVAAFGRECMHSMLANESFIVTDVDADPRIARDDIPAYRATNIEAVICVPLHKWGKFTAAMAVHQATPRNWTREEIELVELVVARCWESIERARTVRSLSESEQRLRFMAESMPQKIFTAKPTGEIDYFNRQWTEFTGLSGEQMPAWDWARFTHPDDVKGTVRRWEDAIVDGKYFELEHRFRRHDGVYRWHLSRAHAMRDAQSHVLMWIGSSTDIDDQKRAEENLERIVAERTAQLRDTVQQLETFSYSIVHDMRAPLRSMRSFAGIIEADYGDKLDDLGRQYLARIMTSASRLDALITDVLSYSRVSVNQTPLQRVELDRLVPEVLAEYPQFQEAAQRIHVEHPLPAVQGNGALLTQVVSNLIGNALKFVPADREPRVVVRAELRENQRVRLWIEDNGIGIAPEHREQIFGLFHRLHGPDEYAGTGVGLAIVKKAVERMGGAVGVESELNQGSRFWMELNAA